MIIITTHISSVADELYSIIVIIIFVHLLVTTIRTFPTVPSISNNDVIMDMVMDMDMDMDHSKAATTTTVTTRKIPCYK